MNRLLAENATTGKYEIVSSTNGALNTTGGGGDGQDDNAIIKACTDITDPTTAINLKSTVTGSLHVENGSFGHLSTIATKTTNMSTAQTSTTLGTGQATRMIGTTNGAGTGTVYYAGVDTQGRQYVNVDLGVQIDGKNDAGAGKDLRCDDNGRLYAGLCAYTDITDDTTTKRLKCDANGKLDITTTQTAVSPVSGASTLPAVQMCGYNATAPEMNVVKLDTNGNLLIANDTPINRGSITFPAPFGSGATSTAVDVGNYKTFHFHTEGSAGSSHAGFIIQGSNDNTNWVKIQLFTPQTVASVDSIRGSISMGYRYYRLENGGTSVSVTTSIYNLYS